MVSKTSLYHQNKGLFFVSLISVILMLTGLFYGFSVTQMITTQKENEQLKHQIDSLKFKLNENNWAYTWIYINNI